MSANLKNYLKIILIIFTVAIVPLSVFLVKQRQEIRKGATESSNPGQIKLSPSSSTYTPGQPLNVDIVFNTGGVFVSGIGATVIFDNVSDFTVSEIEKKTTGLDYCSLFKQTTVENSKIKMGIACFASGAGMAFSQDTVLGSFTVTPSTSANGNFSIEFFPQETQMKREDNGQIVSILGSLPSPAGVYGDQTSPISPPLVSVSPTQPPASTATPPPPTPTPSPGETEGGCSDTSFSATSDIGYLAANPEKTLKKFIANTSGTVSSAELYFSSWNNSPRQITLWINDIEASNQATVPKSSGSWYQFNFQTLKPEITIGQTIRVEVLQDANWDTATAWNRDGQDQVLKLKIDCSPTPTLTSTPTPTPTTTTNPTATPVPPTATQAPSVTPSSGATQTPAPPSGTPAPVACSTGLLPSQCTCTTTVSQDNPPCGVVMRQRGDFDCSGKVDVADFTQWVIGFAYQASPRDMDCDGQPGIGDLNTWLTNYLNSSQP